MFLGLLEIHFKMAAEAIKLAETFSTSPQKPLNEIQQNLTGSNISKFTTKFVFLPYRKTKMAAPASDWPRRFQTSPLKPLNGIQ